MELAEAAAPLVVAAVGSCCVDLMGVVDRFPRPDDKTRTRHFQVEGGGNCGNVVVALSRLGVTARPLAKLGTDAWGKLIAQQLRDEGVDARCLVIKPGVSSPFTYVIVDQATKTRTCLHTPLSEDFLDHEFCQPAQLEALLNDCRLLFLDSRHPRAARLVALEARRRAIPVLMDIEKVREGMLDLLPVVDSLNTSSHFPAMYYRERTGEEAVATSDTGLTNGLAQLLIDYPLLRFIVTTLGERGSIWTERAASTDCEQSASSWPSCGSEMATVEAFIEHSYARWRSCDAERGDSSVLPQLHIPVRPRSRAGREAEADSAGSSQWLRVWYCPPQRLGPDDVVDTTGAGDAFTAATIFALVQSAESFGRNGAAAATPDVVLPLASFCAARNCTRMGARAGLPTRADLPAASARSDLQPNST